MSPHPPLTLPQQKINQLIGKEKIMYPVAIVMIKVCFCCSIVVLLFMNPELFYYTSFAVWPWYVCVMILLYFWYVSATIILRFFYTSTKPKLLHKFYSYSLILCYYYDVTDNYVTKELLIEAMIWWIKRNHTEKSPPRCPNKETRYSITIICLRVGAYGSQHCL